MTIELFDVWCGGEVFNRYPVQWEQAKQFAEDLRKLGGEDVVIEPTVNVNKFLGETK